MTGLNNCLMHRNTCEVGLGCRVRVGTSFISSSYSPPSGGRVSSREWLHYSQGTFTTYSETLVPSNLWKSSNGKLQSSASDLEIFGFVGLCSEIVGSVQSPVIIAYSQCSSRVSSFFCDKYLFQ